MATAHLLFGYLGAGKTTLAKALEARHGAVRFSPDAWMARLFGADPPAEGFAANAAAILALMEPLWGRCLERGVDVVLDYGFWRRAERDRVRGLCAELGAEAILYRLDCPEAVARARVAARNRQADGGLFIAPQTFDALKARFEPLGPEEAFVPA